MTDSLEGRDADEVFFIGSSRIQPGEAELHRGDGGFSRSLGELKEEWRAVMANVGALVAESSRDAATTGFQLDEITVSLGFNAKGKLAFIAEVGVDASIEMKFKRE